MKIYKLIFGFLFLCLCVSICTPKKDTTPRKKYNTQKKYDNASPAFRLAVLDGQTKKESDLIVSKYKNLISEIGYKYGLEDSSVADKTYYIKSKLEERFNISVQSYDILNDINNITGKDVGITYPEIISTYYILRKDGNSHYSAIKSIEALVKGFESVY